jgi:carboxymethylenebutenolidase
VANSIPRVSAEVDYYGVGSDDDLPPDQIPHLPPLLSLHGEADSEVQVARAHRLYGRMRDHGGNVEMHLYPGAQLAFDELWASTYPEPDAAAAWRGTMAFLRARLAR